MEATVVGFVDERKRLEDEALAALSTTPVLISADSAAAVEHLARRIHAASARAGSPFVLIAAAGLPLDAAMLAQTCRNLLDVAAGGTLLLTDVEQMPAVVQDRLIETFASLQAGREPACGIRLIAGTTTSLYDRISGGSFSAQLFYRLNVIHVVAENDARDKREEGRVA